jgi:hypothetical protein
MTEIEKAQIDTGNEISIPRFTEAQKQTLLIYREDCRKMGLKMKDYLIYNLSSRTYQELKKDGTIKVISPRRNMEKISTERIEEIDDRKIAVDVPDNRISLIIEANTGIVWRNQAGCQLCTQVEAEGYLVLLDVLNPRFEKLRELKDCLELRWSLLYPDGDLYPGEPEKEIDKVMARDARLTFANKLGDMICEIQSFTPSPQPRLTKTYSKIKEGYCFNPATYNLADISLDIDYSRIDEFIEDWWPVSIQGYYRDYERQEYPYSFVYQKGYICLGRNCD